VTCLKSPAHALDASVDSSTALRFDKMKKDVYIHKSSLPMACRRVLQPGEEIDMKVTGYVICYVLYVILLYCKIIQNVYT
jgi:hypothetical protein